MRVIRYRELLPSPWKNGLGVTREIAQASDERFAVGFAWRLSRAVVADSAPFSRFDGVRRWLGLAQGGAFELRIDERAPHTLEKPGDVLSFPGDVGCEGVPLMGAIEDLNLMLADPALDAEMLARPMVGSLILARGDALAVAWHVLDGKLSLQGGRQAPLGAGDTLLLDAGQPELVRGVGSGLALFVRVFARTSGAE